MHLTPRLLLAMLLASPYAWREGRCHADGVAPAPPEGSPGTVVATPGKGVTFRALDDRLSLTVRTRVQMRETYTRLPDAPDTTESNPKTFRLTTTGHVLDPATKFTVQLAFGAGDYEAGNPSPVFDAFVESTHLRDLNVRVGQFFVPLDRARTIREFALQLVDRQIAVRELSLDRDVGVMLSSTDLGGLGWLGYNVFVGGGDGRNRTGGQQIGPLVIGRVVVRPWGTFDDDQEADLTRAPRPRLAIGLAGGYNHDTPRAQSTFGATYTLGAARYVHAAADVVFKHSGFSLLAEGLLRHATTDARTAVVDGETVTESPRSGWGYFVQAGQMVTSRLEVSARWDQLFTEEDTDPTLIALARTQGRQAGAGVSYYLNGHAFKVQADVFHVFGPDDTDGRQTVRVQLDATF